MKSQISAQMALDTEDGEIPGFYNPEDGKFYVISAELLQPDNPFAHQLEILLKMFSQGVNKSK